MRKNCLDAIRVQDPESAERLTSAPFQQVSEFINTYNSGIQGADVVAPGQLNLTNARPAPPRMYPPVRPLVLNPQQMMGAPMYGQAMMYPGMYNMYP